MRHIYSNKDFYRIVERERDRADRNNHGFAILIFEAKDPINFSSLVPDLIYAVNRRIRYSDEIGWINRQHFGIMLPYTLKEGARRIADDICSLIVPKESILKYKIVLYPTNWINNNISEQTRSWGTQFRRNMNANRVENNLNILQELGPILPRRISFKKRAFDVVLVLILGTFLLPLMLLIAMLIKMVSPGPVLFKQKRVGYMGKTFFCWKFRTMGLGASTSLHQNYLSKLMNNEIPMAKLDDADKRIIPFGKFMRKSGLDELPQLFNVLCGEMSLIGPRPCIPYESRQFLNWQHKRFDAVPGITGLWQVNGKNMTTFNEMMRYDISYTKKKSLWLDIKILFKTLPVIIHQVSSLNRYPKFGSSHGRGQREPQHQ